VKQHLPNVTVGIPHTLASYLLLCGLAEKLRELFRRAEVKSMKLFDGGSPVPLLLLRAMGFLGNLVTSYRMTLGAREHAAGAGEAGGSTGGSPAADSVGLVLQMLRRTELFGIVNILGSILLCEGRREKSAAASLPQTVISLSFQALRILNQVARLELATLQETLGACRRHELYHLLVCLIDYCTARIQGSKLGQDRGQEENELLHETIILLGYYCLERPENQSIMCYGEGQTLLAKITSLPLYYFMDDKGKGVLFPTILATCFKSPQNLELLRGEMNMSLLQKYLAAKMLDVQIDEARSVVSEDGMSLPGRFPPALWQAAVTFFSDEAPAAGDGAGLVTAGS